MKLSQGNAIALLIDLNQNIEEYADAAVINVIEGKNYNYLTYPPNNGLTDLEKAELDKLANNQHLKNALRKIIADNNASVIFNMLNLFDGTSEPKQYHNEWTGVKIVDEEYSHDSEAFIDTLHDSFLETYWEWKKIRGDKGWQLDTL